MTERNRAPGVPGGAAVEGRGWSGTGWAVAASVRPVSAPLGAVGTAGTPGAAGVLTAAPAADPLRPAPADTAPGTDSLAPTTGAALAASAAGAVSLHFSGAVGGGAPQGVGADGGV